MADLAIKAKELEILEALANKHNGTKERAQVPLLKINYDDFSKHPKGVWVVGQRKDDSGDIIDEGKIAKELIILQVRNRYSLYNEANKDSNCSSPYHFDGEQVRGNKHGFVCGKACKYRALDAKPRCSAQKVVFGIAITEDGEEIECIAYIKGTSYFPFVEYISSAQLVKINGNLVKVPLYAFKTILAQPKVEKKGSRIYYVAQFERGKMHTIAEITEYAKKADLVISLIEQMNVNITMASEADGVEDEPKKTIIIELEGTQENIQEVRVDDDDDDVGFGDIDIKSEKIDDLSLDDIEAQVKKMLAG